MYPAVMMPAGRATIAIPKKEDETVPYSSPYTGGSLRLCSLRLW